MKSGRTRREEGVRKIEKEEQSTIAVLFLVLLLVSLPLFFFFDFARDTIPKLAANYTANIYAEQSEREREREGEDSRNGQRKERAIDGE